MYPRALATTYLCTLVLLTLLTRCTLVPWRPLNRAPSCFRAGITAAIKRDEATHTTTYEVSVPSNLVAANQATLSAKAAFGIAIGVNGMRAASTCGNTTPWPLVSFVVSATHLLHSHVCACACACVCVCVCSDGACACGLPNVSQLTPFDSVAVAMRVATHTSVFCVQTATLRRVSRASVGGAASSQTPSCTYRPLPCHTTIPYVLCVGRRPLPPLCTTGHIIARSVSLRSACGCD